MAVIWLCQRLHVLFSSILLHSTWILNVAATIFLYFSPVLNSTVIISGKPYIGPTRSTPCAVLCKHWFYFFLTILFVCLSVAVSDYRQSLQFQNLNKEKQNIQLEVCNKVMKTCYCLFFLSFSFCCLKEWEYLKLVQVMRGGRIMKISIFDIVVGDVVPLRIGDQVSFIPHEFSVTMLWIM